MFKVEVLDIYLHGDLIGQLFRFDNGTTKPSFDSLQMRN